MFPELIKKLPEANIPFEGIKGWLSQGADQQLVFFEIDAVGEVPSHSHGAQWGIVVEGEMDLTIGGETKVLEPGDAYYFDSRIPHRFRNIGEEDAEIISACSPPAL